MIEPEPSAEIHHILLRISQLFARYYELPSSAPAEDKIVGELYDQIQALRDHLWYEVDLDTAVIMDKEDGYSRPIMPP